MNPISSTHGTQSPKARASEYKVLCVEPTQEPPRLPLPGARKGRGVDGGGKSAGGDSASAAGCNANNGNGSARTANCNNALSNGNDNYAGAFAMTNGETQTSGEPSTARPARPNKSDNPAATGGQGRCDYGQLPFMGGGSAESNATATVTGSGDIFTELRIANSKRKLKGMEKFFEDPAIVEMAVDRALSKAKKTPEVVEAKRHKKQIAARIIHQFKTRTYRMGRIKHRPIPPKNPDGKWREGDIYEVFDRVVPNGKDSAYYLRVQAIRVTAAPDGGKKAELVVFRSGAFEIKTFFKRVEAGLETLPRDTTVIRSGKGIAFACCHVTDEEACDAIVADLERQGITI